MIIVIFLLFLVLFYLNTNLEGMVNISPIERDVTWKMAGDCKKNMTKTLANILDQNSLKNGKVIGDDWVIYFPCSYNWIKKEISKINPTNKDQRIFIVNNADELTSKNNLWKNLVYKYGRDIASQLSPVSYILTDKNDMDLFEKEYDPSKIYILKKNIQRQEGLLITQNKHEIKKASNDMYAVVQELLQDPYLIDGRKINMRIYLLLVCQNNEISAYVHREGFMYYTKVPFKKGTIDNDHNITTGYIDREVYEKNPLTHSDFRKYLDDPDRECTYPELQIKNYGYLLSAIVFNRIYVLLQKVVLAVSHTICQGSHLQPYITFQLFGADIAIDDQLKPKIIEVNKGPDLGVKDDRDSNVKHNVVNDIFKILKIIPDEDNQFIKIIE